MHDLATEVALAHLAEHADALARHQRLLMVRIEVEEAQDELPAVPARHRPFVVAAAGEDRHQLPPGPVLDLGADDRALRLLLDTRHELLQRDDARVILVAQRQVQDEILLARDAQLDELVGEAPRGALGRRAPAAPFLGRRHGNVADEVGGHAAARVERGRGRECGFLRSGTHGTQPGRRRLSAET